MKKISALVLVLAMVSVCPAAEWNLDEMIHPQLKDIFSKMPAIEINSQTVKDLQATTIPSPESLPKDEAVEVHDETTASGLRIRIYTPKIEQKEFPGLLWLHGGGHILGAPEITEDFCIRFAKEAKCIVAAPDYRLAPDYPYPADVEDCYSALVWMTENLPVKKDKIAVAGQSAGGGLTASVTLMARDRKGPAICFQMPLYPMLDHRNITPSSHQINDHRAWCRDFNIEAWKMYLANVSGDVPAYASPALAEDVSNLPPAYIMVGELDPFRDEDITYAQRLMQAGVPVEFRVIPGVFHGFEIGDTETEIAKQTRDEYVKALAEALK